MATQGRAFWVLDDLASGAYEVYIQYGSTTIDIFTADVIDGKASAVVTNPIAKSVLYKSGFDEPGHTEYLAKLSFERTVAAIEDDLAISEASIRSASRSARSAESSTTRCGGTASPPWSGTD